MTETKTKGHGLRAIDCKLDVLNHLDRLIYEQRLDPASADRLKLVVRYFNGNTLFVLYLLWIKQFEKQKAVAEYLGISTQRVSKIVRDDLANLRATLILGAASHNTADPLELDPWVYGRDVVYDVTEDNDTVLHSDGDKIGSVVKAKSYVRRGRKDQPDVGETNARYYPRRKDPDDIAADAIREFHREQRAEQRLRARIAEKNAKSLADDVDL